MNHEELFDKFLQRTLTRDEAARLKDLLKDDPDAGRSFVEHVGETSLLIRVGTQLRPEPERPVEEGQPIRSLIPRFARLGWKWAAAVVCAATLTTAGWFALRPAPELRARVGAVNGDVRVLRELNSLAAEPGLPLRQGDIVLVDSLGRGVVIFDGEATRVELQAGAQARFAVSRRGKRIELKEGALEAMVAPQPKDRPLTLATLHAEARVAGTRLILASETSSTRLEVSAGSVAFTRRADGKSLLVKEGFCATAGPNAEWCCRPFLPEQWQSRDIGAVRLRGQARFDGSAFRVRGAGQDTCCKKDQLHYVYQPLHADGEIRARLREIEFTDPEAKASVMIRQSLKSASKQASLGLTASGGLEFESRMGTESHLRRTGHSSTPCWLRLARSADIITAFKSADGTNWVEVASQNLALGEQAYIGLGVTSFNHAALTTSVFDNVTLVAAAPGASPVR